MTHEYLYCLNRFYQFMICVCLWSYHYQVYKLHQIQLICAIIMFTLISYEFMNCMTPFVCNGYPYTVCNSVYTLLLSLLLKLIVLYNVYIDYWIIKCYKYMLVLLASCLFITMICMLTLIHAGPRKSWSCVINCSSSVLSPM